MPYDAHVFERKWLLLTNTLSRGSVAKDFFRFRDKALVCRQPATREKAGVFQTRLVSTHQSSERSQISTVWTAKGLSTRQRHITGGVACHHAFDHQAVGATIQSEEFA